MVKTAGIIANGPSATAEDALKLRGIVDELIAVNDAYKLCKGVDGEYFCDAIYGTDYKWWKWAYPDVLRDFEGDLITQRLCWQILPESWGIKAYDSEDKPGLCTQKDTIYTGSNSTYAAVNVAFHRGFRRIYLLGLDLSLDGNRRHAVTDRPDHLNCDSDYGNFCKRFKTIDPAAYGLEIINLSRKTALNQFPLGELDELAA